MLVLWLLAGALTAASAPPVTMIVVLGGSDPLVRLASKELRRYVYATGGGFPTIAHQASWRPTDAVPPGASSTALVLATTDALAGLEVADDDTTGGLVAKLRAANSTDAHASLSLGAHHVLCGASPLAVLYACYEFASTELGVYFAIDGDRIPRRGGSVAGGSFGPRQSPFATRGAVP